jgi:WD40 repeat protein
VEGLIEQKDSILVLSCLDSRGYELNSKGDCEAVSWLTGKQACAVNDNSIACIRDSKLVLMKDGKQYAEYFAFASKPTSLATNGDFIAVGLEDKSIYLLDDSLALLSDRKLEANFGAISALTFSPDGKLLAAGDEQRRIKIYSVETCEPIKSNWCYHNAKISALVWLKNTSEGLLVSGSLDNSLMVWSPTSPIRPLLTISNAHSGPIVSLAALDDGRFASASQDGSLKVWSIMP